MAFFVKIKPSDTCLGRNRNFGLHSKYLLTEKKLLKILYFDTVHL